MPTSNISIFVSYYLKYIIQSCKNTFENGIHSLSVQRSPHSNEKQLFRSFWQIVYEKLRIRWNRFHCFVDGFPSNFCCHQINSRIERGGDSHETHPITVTYSSRSTSRYFIVATKPMPYLQKKNKIINNSSKIQILIMVQQ